MKQLIFTIIFIFIPVYCFCSYDYIGSDGTVPTSTKAFTRSGDYLFVSKASSGVSRHDISHILSLPRPSTTINISDPHGEFDPSSVEASGLDSNSSHVFATYRNGSPAYSVPTFVSYFDDGDTNLINGSSEWSSGCSSGSATLTSDGDPFIGDYSGKLVVPAEAGYAYALKSIQGADIQYYTTWFKVSSLTGKSQGYIYIPVFYDTEIEVLRIAIIFDSDNAFKLRLDARTDVGDYVSSEVSSPLSLDTWYNVKIAFNVASENGAATLGFRENFADAFIPLLNVSDLDNDTFSPTHTAVGYSGMGGLDTCTLLFEELAVNVSNSLESALWNDGCIAVYTVDPFEKIAQVNMEAKFTWCKLQGNYLYVASQTRGLIIFDVSDPQRIRFVSNYNIGSFETQGLDVAGQYVYIANYTYGLSIVDVSNPEVPFEVSRSDFNKSIRQLWQVVVDGDYLYGSVHTTTCFPGDRGLAIIDITDKTAPAISVFPFTSDFESTCVSGDDPPYQIFKDGNYIYLSNGDKGITVADVKKAQNPKWIENITIPVPGENIRALYVKDRLIYCGGNAMGPRDIYGFIHDPEQNKPSMPLLQTITQLVIEFFK